MAGAYRRSCTHSQSRHPISPSRRQSDEAAQPDAVAVATRSTAPRSRASGANSAIAVIAVAERGSMFNPGPCVYMEKIAVGAEARDVVDLDAPVMANLEAVAKAKGEQVKDVRFGIGGTPEGVIAACALKALGGEIQGRLFARNETERQAALDGGYDLDSVLTTDDLVSSDDVFFSASGVTEGDILRGVRYRGDGASTETLVMCSKTGTIRRIQTNHQWQKLMRYSSLDY
jgi:fructose-1,6-bisphosphatase II